MKKAKAKGTVKVSIPRDCYEKIKQLAAINGRKISGQIEFMLRDA